MRHEDWYLETEMLLSLYWLNKDRLARLQAKKRVLVENLKLLESKMGDIKRIPGLTAKYGIVSYQKRKNDFDYAMLMEEYEKQVDDLTKQILLKNKKLASIEYRLYELMEYIAPFEVAMAKLTDEEHILTEQKYLFRKSNYQIADLLNCSEKRVRYMYQKIINQMAEWFAKKETAS